MSTIFTPEQFRERYGDEGLQRFKKQEPIVIPQRNKKPGFVDRTKEALGERLEDIKSTFGETARGDITPVETAVRTVGDFAGGIGDIIGEATSPALQPVLEKVAETEIGKKAFEAINQGAEKYNEWKKETPENTRIAESIEGLTNIASLFPVAKGGQVVTKGATNTARTGVQGGRRAIDKGVDLTKKLTPAPPTQREAVGQVLQGTTDDVAQGAKALKSIDIKNVNTFQDLDKQLSSKITELSKKVDADLTQDTTKRFLDDIFVNAPSGGTILQANPIKQAINQLDELYETIGDTTKLIEIRELRERAIKEGLTAKEVNDLARMYGSEFGRKAFNKIGDPLTSVNAQLYENVRQSVKRLARAGIKGSDAKAADETMSAIFNTQRLVQKNVESVNKLRQKIQQRGLLEKLGHGLTKTLDVISRGTVRGLVGGVLPRGVGNKLMNALDLEKVLQKNLKIIQDALEAESDNAIIKILNKIKS